MPENTEWWKDYFDELYLEIYKKLDTPEKNQKEAEFIRKALDLPPGSHLLDLACGQGRHAVELADMGFRVTGLDFSPVMLQMAVKRANERNVDVSFVNGDMRDLPFPENHFDGVYSFYTSFGYFDDDDNFKVLKEVARVLKPGGRFLIEYANPLLFIGKLPEKHWFSIDNYFVLESHHFDPVTMRIYNDRKILVGANIVDERQHFVRFYNAAELTFLMKLVGLRRIKLWGDHNFSDYDVDSPRLIMVAEKEQGDG